MEETTGVFTGNQEPKAATLVKTDPEEKEAVVKQEDKEFESEEKERKIFGGLTEAEHRERFPLAHLDERWKRTVWYCEHERRYKSRDPTKEVQWGRPAGWKPETAAEAETRAICSRYKIWRLNQEDAKVGCVYNYFGHPDKKVRILEKVYRTAPRVLVIPHPTLDQDAPKVIFADELEARRHHKRTKKRANQSRSYKKFKSIS